MKPQKTPEQADVKEELDIKQIKNKYGGEEYIEMDYSILIESQSTSKAGSNFTEEDYRKRLGDLHEELKQIKTDLTEARQNGRDTGPIYREKQNLEQKIHKVKQRLDQIKNKPDDQNDDEKNLEKAKLLSRQGIVNIRPQTVEYRDVTKRKKF
jgi:hypothetical protein